MIEVRQGTHKLYKGHYFIVFYDITDEVMMYMFDNVRDILKFLNRPITRNNIIEVNTVLCKALKTDSHITRLLNEPLRVYIIDTK